jgi:hypothetical protein
MRPAAIVILFLLALLIVLCLLLGNQPAVERCGGVETTLASSFPLPAPAVAQDPSPKPQDLTPAPAPVDEIPLGIRGKNYVVRWGWLGRHVDGSCFHVACQDVLRKAGYFSEAAAWKARYGGRACLATVLKIAQSLGLRAQWTIDGDEEFLESCQAAGQWAAIYWGVDEPADHAVVFCGFEQNGQVAVLLGVNRPDVTRFTRDEFLNRWRASGGIAVTFGMK